MHARDGVTGSDPTGIRPVSVDSHDWGLRAIDVDGYLRWCEALVTGAICLTHVKRTRCLSIFGGCYAKFFPKDLHKVAGGPIAAQICNLCNGKISFLQNQLCSGESNVLNLFEERPSCLATKFNFELATRNTETADNFFDRDVLQPLTADGTTDGIYISVMAKGYVGRRSHHDANRLYDKLFCNARRSSHELIESMRDTIPAIHCVQGYARQRWVAQSAE